MDANDGEEIVNLAEEPAASAIRLALPTARPPPRSTRKGALSLPCSNEFMHPRRLQCAA
jgi:hypothetical protein